MDFNGILYIPPRVREYQCKSDLVCYFDYQLKQCAGQVSDSNQDIYESCTTNIYPPARYRVPGLELIPFRGTRG